MTFAKLDREPRVYVRVYAACVYDLRVYAHVYAHVYGHEWRVYARVRCLSLSLTRW